MRDTIRLFVSSTFRDLTEERDMLNRIVFPHLREFCRERGIGFVGVDLRWGITEEDAESKKTLKICLDEIDRCRPYFAGILGNRYGWIPPSEFVVESQKEIPQGVSITEAEMLYGALNRRGADAIFLIKERDRARNTVENVAKLSSLRRRIRRAGYPLLDGYKSADEISDFFIREFKNIIARNHPYVEVPDKYQLDSIRQNDYMNEYLACFVGREKELEKLSRLVDKSRGIIFVEGGEGSGRTALLANYVQRRLLKSSDSFTFFCFSEALSGKNEWGFTLMRLIKALNIKTGRADYEPESIQEVIVELSNALKTASASLKSVVIVFDGVDAITRDSRYGFAWIPEKLPKNIKIVVTTKDLSTREIILNRKCRKLLLPPLSKKERQSFIERYLFQYAKKLDFRFIQAVIANKHTQNPLFLKVLMSEMVLWNNYEGLFDRLRFYLDSDSLSALYVKVLNRLEEEYGVLLTAGTFELLYAAAEGLKESELIRALETTQGEWIPLFYAIRPYIFESLDVISLTNAQFRQAIKEKYITKSVLKSSLDKLVSTFAESEDDKRKLAILPGLLAQTRKYSKLSAMFSQPETFSCLWSINRNIALKHYALLAEKFRPFNKYSLAKAAKKKRGGCDAEALYNIAEFYRHIGDTAEAAAILDRLQADPLITDLQRLKAYSSYGNIRLHDGDYRGARKVFQEKKKLCGKMNHPLELARTNASLGQIAYLQSDFKKAISSFRAAKREFEQCGHAEGVQAALGNLGNVYCNTGAFKRARALFKRQEQLCRETNNLVGLISTLGGQFLVCLKAKAYDEAGLLLSKQRKLCLAIGDADKLQTVVGNQAILAYQRGDFEEAARLTNEKYDIAYRLNSFVGQNNALANLADLSYQTGDVEKAIEYAEARAALCRRVKNPAELCAALYRLSYFLHSAGRLEESNAAAHKSMVLMSMHGITRVEDRENHLLFAREE